MPQILYINGWPGGLNTSLSAKDIADDELQDAVNVELNQRRALRRRHGVSYVRDNGAGGYGPFTSKVTSIYHYRLSDGTETVIYTDKTNAWRRAPSAPESVTAFTAIDGALPGSTGLATSDFFRWATMDDVAVGVNGGTDGATFDNPVVLTSATGNLTDVGTGDSWTGTWPSAPTDIAVWNRRMWLVEGNVLYGSALGDRTDWLSTGGSGRFQETIGEDEGDTITGIYPYLDRLIIFKEHSIYQLVAGSPNVDANQYEIRLLTDRVGCIRKETIQRVVNDLVFLSHFGVMSLQATAQYGDLLQSQLSQKIPELASVNKDGTFPTSIIHPEKNQYWLSVPTDSASAADNAAVYVLDFQDLGSGQLPWMKFDGGVVGASYGTVTYLGKPYVYIGGYQDAYIYDADRWDDNINASETQPSPAKFVTKAYDVGEPLRRKDWYRVGVQVQALTNPLDFELQWRLDTDPNRAKAVTGQFVDVASGSELANPGLNAELWNDALTVGSFIFATDAHDDSDIVWSIRGRAGRRAQVIELTFQNASSTQAFEVRRMMLVFDVLQSSSFGVRDFSG